MARRSPERAAGPGAGQCHHAAETNEREEGVPAGS